MYKVDYSTTIAEYEEIIDNPNRLEMDLPKEVLDTNWDIIFVDSPEGLNASSPGRMQSIYTASKLAKKGCVVFIHDTEREVEKLYCNKFFNKKDLVAELKRKPNFSKKQFLRKYKVSS